MNKINSEMHISINTRENLNHITLLYGEPKKLHYYTLGELSNYHFFY